MRVWGAARRRRWLGVLAFLLTGLASAWGQSPTSTGLPLPRFVSLADDEVNLRFGPGKDYPIRWVYLRRELPVRIVEEYYSWRKVEDSEGNSGWVHASLLSSRRTVLVQGGVRDMRRAPSPGSAVILQAESGVVGRLYECRDNWCQVEIADRRGWMERSALWGVPPS